MYIEIELGKIHPNPFRDLGNYPLMQDKLESLRESISTTGWWENLVCRSHPDKSGEVQLAYGHHRLAVLRETYSNDEKIGMIQKDLDDTAMWKVMVREDMESYHHSIALVDFETVRAWLRGVADGTIDAPVVSQDTPKSQRRYAPSAAQGDVVPQRDHVPYTSTSLMEAAGWSKSKTVNVLVLVEGIEYGVVKLEQLEGRGTRQAADLLSSAVVEYRKNRLKESKARQNIKKAKKDAHDIEPSSDSVEKLKTTKRKMKDIKKAVGRAVDRTPVDAGHRTAQKESNRAMDEIRGPGAAGKIDIEKKILSINKWIHSFTRSNEQQQLDFFIEHRDHLTEDERDLMVEELTRVRNLADAYIRQLTGEVASDEVIEAEYTELIGDGSGP